MGQTCGYASIELLLAEHQRYRRALAAVLFATPRTGATMSWYVREDGTVADLDDDGPVKDDEADDVAGRTR